jgi:serine/threonine protein phosphatase PrpC
MIDEMLTDRLSSWLRHWETGTGTGITPLGSTVLSTDLGLTRSENQDRIATLQIYDQRTERSLSVVAVADGMGGMADGLICATRTIACFFDSIIRLRAYDPLKCLQLAAIEANTDVYRSYKGKGGATLSAALVDQYGKVATLNVGDSRIYGRLTNGKRPEIVRLTTDDNLEEAVGGTGKELLQFIGMGTGIRPHVRNAIYDIDRLILSTDGVHFINSAVFSDISCNATSILDTAKQLLTYARWRGSPDNASIAVIDIEKCAYELTTLRETGFLVTDPFGSLELGFESFSISKRRSPLPKQQAIPDLDSSSPAVRRVKRTRPPAPIPEKQKEPDNQLSIEIESSPLTDLKVNK